MTRMVKGDARLEEIDMLWEITKQIEVRRMVAFSYKCLHTLIANSMVEKARRDSGRWYVMCGGVLCMSVVGLWRVFDCLYDIMTRMVKGDARHEEICCRSSPSKLRCGSWFVTSFRFEHG
jgi:hypothetical protein